MKKILLWIFKPFIALWKIRYNYIVGRKEDNKEVVDGLINDIDQLRVRDLSPNSLRGAL